jgi:hypothetical protein
VGPCGASLPVHEAVQGSDAAEDERVGVVPTVPLGKEEEEAAMDSTQPVSSAPGLSAEGQHGDDQKLSISALPQAAAAACARLISGRKRSTYKNCSSETCNSKN